MKHLRQVTPGLAIIGKAGTKAVAKNGVKYVLNASKCQNRTERLGEFYKQRGETKWVT